VRTIAIVALVMLAGCPGLTAHSRRSAPGHVELDHAPVHEHGDPAAYEAATDPGEYRAMILPGAYSAFGNGRRFDTAELGVQLRFTFAERYDQSAPRDELAVVERAWGAAIGWGFAQIRDDDTMSHATIGGPIYAELDHTLAVCGVGAGVAVYTDHVEAGPQLTAWCGPFLFRMRYQASTGTEVYGGFELELPTVWTWSR
jgi:hypothetical protein